MKKHFSKILYSAVLAAGFTLCACQDETVPQSNFATHEQATESSSELEGAVRGINSQMTKGYLVYGDQVHETDLAYPQFMIAMTEMLGDVYPGGSDSGYDWFRTYNTGSGNMADNSYYAYLPWFTCYQFIKTANDIISTVDLETASDLQKSLAGSAYAARAFDYFILTTLYEPVANKYTDCSKVLGLTAPIVTDKTTPDEAKNNPRVKHEEMVDFIKSDLDIAEECLKTQDSQEGYLPSLAVVYGLKAKVAIMDDDWATAAKYARMAIDESGATPMTEDEWTNPTKGFTKATSAWMWYVSYSAEGMYNLANATGWLSAEADWGYSSLTCPMIDRSLYDKIGKDDFRKHVFLDSLKYDYYNYQTCRDKQFIEDAPAYLGMKFRCADGNFETYTVGGVVDIPIMRVEEMYFIEALAVGESQGVAQGVDLLTKFMQQYRNPKFSTKATDLKDFERTLLDQMRIEFWMEGNAFPIAKHLKVGVMQNYEGTNAPADIFKINCEGIKPNWTLVIPMFEINSNQALDGWNNPDPTNKVKGPSPVGQYS